MKNNQNTSNKYLDFKFLDSVLEGVIYYKKEKNYDLVFYADDEDFPEEEEFRGEGEFIKALEKLNLEYNPSLTIQENLRLLKEKGKIVNYRIYPFLGADEIILDYKKLIGGDYVFYTNKGRRILINWSKCKRS